MQTQDIEQGTEAWKKIRLGRVTASRIADVMAQGRSGKPSATRANYMAQLVAERLTEVLAETYSNAAMQHGTDTEPQARAQYMMRNVAEVVEVGFVPHPDGIMAGASPDALVDDNGGLEIKCPNTATHIATLRGAAIDRKYLLQMQWNMVCTGRHWWDFVSYDPRLPDDLAYHCRRVERDPILCAEINSAVVEFLVELDRLESELRRMQEAA